MEISHIEARRLIQFSLDGSLDPTDREALRRHLAQCTDCHTYEEEIGDTEKILRNVMQQAWLKHPAPLSIDTLSAFVKPKQVVLQVVAMRLSVFTAILALIAFSIWQLSITSQPDLLGHGSPVIPPIPTGSMQLTSTLSTSSACGEIRYTIQANDTLAKIAMRFSVPEEAIMTANEMRSEVVTSGRVLVIPQCHSTPTGTVSPSPSLTITAQPQTPGGLQ